MLKRLVICSVALVALAAAVTESAQASEIYRTERGGHVLMALPGEANDISIAYHPAERVYVIEDRVGITVSNYTVPGGQRCVQRSPTVVACVSPRIWAELGDGNDRLEVTTSASPETVRVQRERGGKTYVVRAPRGITVVGGAGDDVLIGNEGADVLSGDHDFSGDPTDRTRGNDTIVGGGGPDDLLGGRGNDRLEAGAGDDEASGGAGNDFVDGGDGEDDLEFYEFSVFDPRAQSDGADRVLGGTGNDEIFSLWGRDVIDSGGGADRVFSRDADRRRPDASRIVCGGGADWVEPERGDVVSGCERVFVLPRCRRCTVSLQADLGRGRRAIVASLFITVRGSSVALVTLGPRVRALLKRRGSLRVRITYPGGGDRVVFLDWFVLKR